MDIRDHRKAFPEEESLQWEMSRHRRSLVAGLPEFDRLVVHSHPRWIGGSGSTQRITGRTEGGGDFGLVGEDAATGLDALGSAAEDRVSIYSMPSLKTKSS